MQNLNEIRWKQRFQNFEKAFKLLEKYVQTKNVNEMERAGGIQFFEMCFELSWKTLKDYLESEGYEIDTPRNAIKQGFQTGILKNGDIWLDGLDDRNLTVHTYDEKKAEEIDSRIKNKYFPIIKEFYETLRGKL